MSKKVKCPNCAYVMPITIGPRATAEGLEVRCKNKKCRQVFEIKVKKGEQSR